MSGPWEQFQTAAPQNDGPWAKFAAPSAGNDVDTPTFDESGKPMAPITGAPGAKLTPPASKPSAAHMPNKSDLLDPVLTQFGTRDRPKAETALAAADAYAGLGPALGVTKALTAPVISGTTKAVGKGATLAGEGLSHALGVTTGAGSAAIQEAAKAGYQGGEAAKLFLANIRNKVPISDIVDSAKAAVGKMKDTAARAYQSGMGAMKNDATQLKFDDIDAAITKASSIGNFHGKTINEAADKAVNDIADTIREWKASDPATFHTPEGFDKLKQFIGGKLDALGDEEKTAKYAVNEIYHAVKGTIEKQSPTYSKVMKDYSEAQEALRELESGLSLKKSNLQDTAIRKLQSIMRNNVSSNYGNRLDMVKSLEEEGGKHLRPSLAGQALNSPTPRTLSGQGAGIMSGTAALEQAAQGHLGPAAVALGTLPLESPRLVGEGAYYVGKGARKVSDLAQRVLNGEAP